MATFRLRKPGGGSALRGGDGFRAQDKRIYEYAASGGLVYGGAADTQFVAAAAPADHGGGFYTKTPAVPIRRRQYGHPVTFLHRADGGIVLSGKADTAYARHSVTHEAPAPTGGIAHGGAAFTEIYRPEEEILLLLAA